MATLKEQNRIFRKVKGKHIINDKALIEQAIKVEDPFITNINFVKEGARYTQSFKRHKVSIFYDELKKITRIKFG